MQPNNEEVKKIEYENELLKVGTAIVHIYGEEYILLKYKVLDIGNENVILEFKNYDEVLKYLNNNKEK